MLSTVPTARIRWSCWPRVFRVSCATERWPRLADGPISILARLLWWAGFVPFLCLFSAELVLLVVLAPLVWLVRGSGLVAWRVDLRHFQRRVGVVAVGGWGGARELARALRELFRRGGGPGSAGFDEVVAGRGAVVSTWEVAPEVLRRASLAGAPYARRRWFLWRRRTSFSESFDALPGGTGEDPLSFLIALPFLLLGGLLLGVAALELLAELVLLPFAVLLRLVRLLAWPIESVRGGEVSLHEQVRGLRASARARHALDAELASGAVPRVPVSA